MKQISIFFIMNLLEMAICFVASAYLLHIIVLLLITCPVRQMRMSLHDNFLITWFVMYYSKMAAKPGPTFCVDEQAAKRFLI